MSGSFEARRIRNTPERGDCVPSSTSDCREGCPKKDKEPFKDLLCTGLVNRKRNKQQRCGNCCIKAMSQVKDFKTQRGEQIELVSRMTLVRIIRNDLLLTTCHFQ